MSSRIEPLIYKSDLTQLVDDVSNGLIVPLENQLVWLTNSDKFYRLIVGGIGNSISHWKDLQIEVGNFLEYNPLNPYYVGNAIRIGATFYICKIDSLIGESPLTHPQNYSVVLTGLDTLSQSFTNVDSVVVNHTLTNPNIDVFVDYLGTLERVEAHIENTNASTFTINFATIKTGEIRLK